MKRFLCVAAVVLVALFVGSSAFATVYTWIGNDANWNSGTLWQDPTLATGTIPTTGDTGYITGTAGQNIARMNVALTGAPTIIVQTDARVDQRANTVNMPLTLDGGTYKMAFQDSGGGNNQAITIQSNSYFEDPLYQDFDMSGTVSGAGKLTVNTTHSGVTQYDLSLAGTNSGWSGGMDILNTASVKAKSATALGTGWVYVKPGGRIQIDGSNVEGKIELQGGTLTQITTDRTLKAQVAFAASTSSTITLSTNLTIDGAISGTGNVTINMPTNTDRNLILTNASNSFSNHIELNGRGNLISSESSAAGGTGSITLNPTGANTVRLVYRSSGAVTSFTLGRSVYGTGVVAAYNTSSTSGYALTGTGKTISPGLSIGKVTFALANLTFDGGSIFDIELASAVSYDQIGVQRARAADTFQSSITLNGVYLQLSMLGSFTPGPADTFTIMDVDDYHTVSGTFSNPVDPDLGKIVLEDNWFATINYGGGVAGGDIVLSNFEQVFPPVAEPAGLSLVGLALLALRRRRS